MSFFALMFLVEAGAVLFGLTIVAVVIAVTSHAESKERYELEQKKKARTLTIQADAVHESAQLRQAA